MQCPNACSFVHTLRISSLKVKWRRDYGMDEAIKNDKRWRLCDKIVREVLKEPGHVIPLRYLEKRRERLHLPYKVQTFLKQYPGLFEMYMDRIKPKTQPVPFLRISDRLAQFLEEEKRIKNDNELLLIDRLKRILMLTQHKCLSVQKLADVKRDFGFPEDLISTLSSKYPNLFRVVHDDDNGLTPPYVQLVSSDLSNANNTPLSAVEMMAQEESHNTPLSAVEMRAQEESLKTGRPYTPAFSVRLPPGMVLKKGMMEWTRNWMECPYISPYVDSTHLDPALPEMEKRTVGVLHEVLSLTVLRRMAVPTLGKFCNDFRLPNAYTKIFTRHPGIFYLCHKGGIETIMLREAYDRADLIDKDPLLLIKEKFCELLKEGREKQAKEKGTEMDSDSSEEGSSVQNGHGIEDMIKDDTKIGDEANTGQKEK
ncbi:hypothetical protein SUGI_1051040 [Cryptomeria japonica]|nr:hypothetical protein SUGI_1051040 [Cryptomeria japonica]